MYDPYSVDDPDFIHYIEQLEHALSKRAAKARACQDGGTYYQVLDELFSLGKEEAGEALGADHEMRLLSGYDRVIHFLYKIEKWAGKHLDGLQDAKADLALVDNAEPSEIIPAKHKVEKSEKALQKSLRKKRDMPDFDEDEIDIINRVYAPSPPLVETTEKSRIPRRLFLGMGAGISVTAFAGAGYLEVSKKDTPEPTPEQKAEESAQGDLYKHRRKMQKYLGTQGPDRFQRNVINDFSSLLHEEEQLAAALKRQEERRRLAHQLPYDEQLFQHDATEKENATLKFSLAAGGLITAIATGLLDLKYFSADGNRIDKVLLLRMHNIASRLDEGIDSMLQEIAAQKQPPSR